MPSATTQVPAGRVRYRLTVAGVVQGVGFRPYVHRLATELRLAGLVGNDTGGVFVEVEGTPDEVAVFEARLVAQAPPLARIERVDRCPIGVVGDAGFRIVASESDRQDRTYVAPDSAVCADCLAELTDPGDRRYRHPFVNCTNCGPRFTIIRRLPYDRPNTTMAGFPMCPACAAEYHDPGDRRFHAQPVACPACGPHLWYERGRGRGGAELASDDAVIAAAQADLAAGRIVAVKGLGGYHLACDGTDETAVGRLRQRKRRPAKPFALMVPDLRSAGSLAVIGEEEAALLEGPQRPIVLVRRRPGGPAAHLVAPGNPYLGVMLPYTPLHHLLFAPVPGGDQPAPRVLVMTSGNLSDEPLCFDDDDARARLANIADAWLGHDRPIHVPCDDSVLRVAGGRVVPVRRSRGYVPLPIRLPFAVEPTLAVGGELKNAFCIGTGRDAWMSQHIGDMGSVATLAALHRSVEQFATMYRVRPRTVAADMHPDYHSRGWAEQWVEGTDRRMVDVQHHHAHVAAVMAEHGLDAGAQVLGFAFDGTGFGPDGAIWGGEVLAAGYEECERLTHLGYVLLPGGDSTIRKPYRAALAHLWAAGVAWEDDLLPVQAARQGEAGVLRRQLERGFNCVPTSSMGRLFDAVAALVGVRQTVSYEAQAAVELEALATGYLDGARRYRLTLEGDGVDQAPLIRAVVNDLRDGHPPGSVAAGLHVAVADLVAASVARFAPERGLDRVALSGGVFQNLLLCDLVADRVGALGVEVLTHRLVPPSDGGLALGQLVVAARRGAGEIG